MTAIASAYHRYHSMHWPTSRSKRRSKDLPEHQNHHHHPEDAAMSVEEPQEETESNHTTAKSLLRKNAFSEEDYDYQSPRKEARKEMSPQEQTKRDVRSNTAEEEEATAATAETSTITTAISNSTISDHNDAENRKVHFATAEPQQHVFAYPYHDDRSLYWWSEVERQGFQKRDSETSKRHRGGTDYAQSVHQVWDSCAALKQDRSRRLRQRRGGATSTESHLSDQDNALLKYTSEDEDAAATTTDDDEARGLEDHILSSLSKNRREGIRGVLDAQKTVQNAHPQVQARVLSKTAAHLSKTSARFARAMADADAQLVAQYYQQQQPQQQEEEGKESSSTPASVSVSASDNSHDCTDNTESMVEC